MEVFTVSFNRKCDFVDFIRNRKDISIRGMSERTLGEKSHVEIYSDKSIRSELSGVLTDYILGPYRESVAQRHITENYPYISSAEKQEIFKMLPYEAYADEIRSTVLDYIKHNDSIDIPGFVRFRIPAFGRNVSADLNRAADSFLAAKEFEEMVALLKYHIKKTPSHGTANLIFKNPHEFYITDTEGNEVDLSEFPYQDGAEKTDLIVGIMVGYAPERIIVHNNFYAEPSVIDALKTVFEDRVSLCEGCEICEINKK